jgi:hypothetical protein
VGLNPHVSLTQGHEGPKESSDAGPSRTTAAANGEIDVMAYQILAHRMPHTPRRIPLLEQEMQDPQANER